MDGSRYFLSEGDTQLLVAPLGQSGKIKYTCVSLSRHFIALGANTGGVYFFQRDGTYLQLLANKEGAVSAVRISPDERSLAVVSGVGWLVLWELRLSGEGVCKRVHVSGLLKEGEVRDVVWDGGRGKVYFGDNLGRVAVTSLPKSVKKSGLLRRSNEVIFQDRSAVVQLDLHGNLLAVSTLSRVVLLPLSSASRTAVQVGRKSRDGQFGGCLDVRDGKLLAYSARPGGRLWEAGPEGDVQSTVKLKELPTCSPSPILGQGFEPCFTSESPASLPLSYLLSLHNGKHLVTWDDTGLYLWQPSSWKLAMWTKDLRGVVGVACVETERGGVSICVIADEGKRVVLFAMETLSSCILSLVKNNWLDQAAKLVFSNLSETMALLRSSPSLHLPLLTITEHNLPHSLQLLSLHSVVRCVLEGGAGSSQGGPQQEERDDSEREFPCDGPPRVHRRSNSWSGVSQELMSQREDGEEVRSLSGSHTPSIPSLSQETSHDPVSIETLSIESSTEYPELNSGVSPPQQLSLTSDPRSLPHTEGAEFDNKPRPLRSQSLQLTGPPRIAMAMLPDHDSDDVIAVPMASSDARVGGKKKRQRRGKKSTTPLLPLLPAPLSEDLLEVPPDTCIPEDTTLPFPEAAQTGGHQLEQSNVQRVMTKMKELAKQGGQNVGLETEALQEALNQPVKKVRELLSSLAAPVPTALSLPETVFVNEGFTSAQELPAPPLSTGAEDDTDGSLQPATDETHIQFLTVTKKTKEALAMAHVYCCNDGLRSTMNSWMTAVEALFNSTENTHTTLRATLTELLTLCLEIGAYGSEDGLIPFLRRYSMLLNGVRTMRVLGLQGWCVREKGWRVLLEREGERDGDMKNVTSQTASAPDLPIHLSRLVTSDPKEFVNICVDSWPAVQVWQVALATYSDQSEADKESHDALLELYADYLSRQLVGGREAVAEDEECLLATLERLLSAGPPLHQLQTEHGKPKPGSHKISWPHPFLLQQLIDLCVSMKSLSRVATLCSNFGYWVGEVKLAAAAGNKGKSLLTVISLGDATLLEEWAGTQLETVSEWKEALQLVMSEGVTGGECVSVLVRQLVVRGGPHFATKIISSVGVAGGGASGDEGVEIHSLLVHLSEVLAQQKSVSRSLLEKVDRHLWSRHPSAVSGELERMEEREREGRRTGEVEETVMQSLEWKPLLEESSRHWGVRVGGGGRCGVCHSHLSLALTGHLPGILLFHCGHAYHRHCLPELACYLCFQKNYSAQF